MGWKEVAKGVAAAELLDSVIASSARPGGVRARFAQRDKVANEMSAAILADKRSAVRRNHAYGDGSAGVGLRSTAPLSIRMQNRKVQHQREVIAGHHRVLQGQSKISPGTP